MRCERCGVEQTGVQSFCLTCGTVQHRYSRSVECELHLGEKAVGLCVLCGKPVCNDCAVTAEGKIFCNNPVHQDWAKHRSVVHLAYSEFESDMIVRNLLLARIESQAFSFRDHIGTYWLPDAGLVRVLVSRSQQEQAQEVLRALHLTDLSGTE